MERYPHILFISRASEATKDDEGNFIVSDPEWEQVSECRDEPNGAGRTVVLTDGKAYQYSSMVYLPSIADPETLTGSQVKIEDEAGAVRIRGTIMRAVNDRKNARLWV